MQQTRLDRWLKERFVHETHVFSLSEPPWVPPGVRLVPLEVTLRNRFRFKMVVRRRSDLDHALAALKAENQTFTTRVEARKVWCRKLLDDPRGGSFTFRIVWLVITVSAVVSAIVFFPRGLLVYVRDAWDFFKQYI
jgi:hypothetical protein